jgi:hypothetical protein
MVTPESGEKTSRPSGRAVEFRFAKEPESNRFSAKRSLSSPLGRPAGPSDSAPPSTPLYSKSDGLLMSFRNSVSETVFTPNDFAFSSLLPASSPTSR